MRDKFPGKPRVLFIALAYSSHTHAWVSLLRDQQINVRVFGIRQTLAPDHFDFPTYDVNSFPSLSPERKFSFRGKSLLISLASHIRKDPGWLEERWLAKVVSDWKPDIVHTLGLDPASFSYYRARKKYHLSADTRWIVTARGGPELSLKRLLPTEAGKIGSVLRQCDQFVADSRQNYRHALEMGLPESRISPLGVMPGTGGVDVGRLSSLRTAPPSRSRIILYPKAYECPASKALPVFEALCLCWEKIRPCRIYLTAMSPETRLWLEALPGEIRKSCVVRDRIPRDELLRLMARSRLMLAPSLSDGIPNTMYEAMAAGTVPVLSPIETIAGVVQADKNVLFARNLYPDEIAQALVRGMSDDQLADTIWQENLGLVSKIANRATILPRVIDNYYKITQSETAPDAVTRQ
jgi:glycosyltransferase involved in cell wall biosynthesis